MKATKQVIQAWVELFKELTDKNEHWMDRAVELEAQGREAASLRAVARAEEAKHEYFGVMKALACAGYDINREMDGTITCVPKTS